MKIATRTTVLFSLLALTPMASGGGVSQAATSPYIINMVKLEAERLPDLNTPRCGHQTLVVDGEIMVAGGHTHGFVPTPTAEFLRLGETEWRQAPTVYSHDFGASAQLRTGEVLLLGGAAEPLGIGQTFLAERYNPQTRTFEGFSCLDTKRMYPTAEQLSDGEVLICGNWYHDDAMELFDGKKSFRLAKDVLRHRASPFVFPTTDGDALILGALDNYGNATTDYPTTVERLRGEPFDATLLGEWQPIRLLYPHPAMASCIGDTARGEYTYLTVVVNRDGRQRIAVVRTSPEACASDSAVCLLPDLPPLPLTGPEGQPIGYFSTVLADREALRGYVVGYDAALSNPQASNSNGSDSIARHYVFAFGYEERQGAICGTSAMLYYTDALPGIGITTPVLTPNGDLVMAGGTNTDNFTPFRAAYRLPIGRPLQPVSQSEIKGARWGLILMILMLLAAITVIWIVCRRSQRPPEEAPSDGTDCETDASLDLMPRILEIMEKEQLYLNSSLTVGDVAERLGVHRNAVSRSINSQPGRTFALVVSGYRVAHAKRLLHQQPDKKLSAVAEDAGFATESSFYRTFKTVTGMTPREWVAQGMKN